MNFGYKKFMEGFASWAVAYLTFLWKFPLVSGT
jgi:hypothetical protein